MFITLVLQINEGGLNNSGVSENWKINRPKTKKCITEAPVKTKILLGVGYVYLERESTFQWSFMMTINVNNNIKFLFIQT